MFNDRAPVYGLASFLFFLSGFTGLVYEVVWFRQLTHVCGSSSLAMAAVAGSFLFGLGLGAWRLGKIADRSASPFVLYGWCEIGIGLLAVLLPYLIVRLNTIEGSLYPIVSSRPLVHYFARFVIVFFVLGLPCLLMGGTLPMLIKELSLWGQKPGESVAWLYAVNTGGGAVGCYAAGFHLMPSIGLQWTNALAAGANVLVGAVVLIWSRMTPYRLAIAEREARVGSRRVEGRSGSAAVGQRFYALHVAVVLTGCAALVLQMVWARQLALILGGSTYAFTAVVVVMLLGIGSGSFIFRVWSARLSNDIYAPLLIITALVLATVCGLFLVPVLTSVVAVAQPLRSFQVFNGLLSISVAAALEFVPAVGMGILFPLLIQLNRAEASEVGRAVGGLYALNALGAIAGASLAPSLVFSYWGTAGGVSLALTLYGVALILLFRPRSWSHVAVGVTCFMMLCAGLWLGVPNDPRVTNVGQYMYGYQDPQYLRESRKILYFREGAVSNVLVTQEPGGHRALRVNGKVDATDQRDMAMQLGLAYFPRMFVPGARDVLVIGLGSGTTSGASLLFPDARITCCEIEPAVLAASRFFSSVNHEPEASPRFRVRFDDGRSYLQGRRDTYDLILSEPSNPWLAGISNLFTRQFYELAKQRLKPGGVLAQWIQAYSFSVADYAMVVRTIQSVFPHSGLIRISDSDTILLASADPIDVDMAKLQVVQSQVDALGEVRSDLNAYFGTSDVATLLLRHHLLDDDGLRRLSVNEGSQIIHTDTNLRLEFDAPLRLFEATAQSVGTAIVGSAAAHQFTDAFERWGCSIEQLDVFHDLAMLFARYDHRDVAIQLAGFALGRDSDNTTFLADQLVLSTDIDGIDLEAAVDKILAVSELEANRVGVAYWKARNHDSAATVFERIVAKYPNSVTALSNLAGNYKALGQFSRAENAIKKALVLDPFSELANKAYRAMADQVPNDGQQNDLVGGINKAPRQP